MWQLPEITIIIGIGCVYKTIEQAMEWIHGQDAYKNKTARFSVLCDRSVDVD